MEFKAIIEARKRIAEAAEKAEIVTIKSFSFWPSYSFFWGLVVQVFRRTGKLCLGMDINDSN